MRDFSFAEGLYLFRGGLCILLQLYPCHEFLAILFIRNADDLNVTYGWVSVEELLDLSRIDILSASNHHVFEPAGDLAVIILVQDAQVTAVQPAFFVDTLVCRHWIIVVAAHDHVAPGANLACLALADHFAGLGVNDLHLCMRHRPSNRRDP